jgi:hypothetical protein
MGTQPVIELQSGGGERPFSRVRKVQVSLSGANAGEATLSGTKTVTTVDGVATFTNLQVTGDASLTYDLQFTAQPHFTLAVGSVQYAYLSRENNDWFIYIDNRILPSSYQSVGSLAILDLADVPARYVLRNTSWTKYDVDLTEADILDSSYAGTSKLVQSSSYPFYQYNLGVQSGGVSTPAPLTVEGLTLAPGVPDADASSISGPSSSTTADGSTTGTVTVSVNDESGLGVPGAQVHLAVTSGAGTLSAAPSGGWITDETGQVTATVTSTTAASALHVEPLERRRVWRRNR